MICTQEKLKILCIEWQRILRLQNWKIKVKICRKNEFILDNCGGENVWDLKTGKSFIRILDALDYPDTEWEQDMEVVLVHELLHLHFATFEPKDDGLENVLMERTIECLANVLVGLKRWKQHEMS